MIRAFIAIEIPEMIRAAVRDAQKCIQQAQLNVAVSWTKIDNLHLTLQFLGEIDEAKVGKIRTILDQVAATHRSMEIPVVGLGAFPSERRPQVLWVGCDNGAGQLNGLAEAIRTALEPLGFPRERRKFTAHLTIGRIRTPQSDAALTRTLDSIKNERFGTLRVEEFHLVQSQLHPEGSIYTKLSAHSLTGDTDHVVKS